MKVIVECPLGGQCEKTTDEGLHRCAWYVNLRGQDPQSNQEIDEWRCSMAWMPVLLTENAMTNRGQTAALESFRNESVKVQKDFTQMLFTAASTARKLTNG